MRKLLLLLLLLCSSALWSQTTVTGVITDAGGNPATSGTVVFDLSPQSLGAEYFIPGVGVIIPSVTCGIDGTGNLKNAALSAACRVWGVDLISPANLTYTLTFNPNGTFLSSSRQQCISGASYSLSNPVFCPVINISPQVSFLNVPPVQANLIPQVNGVFTLGSPLFKYGGLYVKSIFTDSISGVGSDKQVLFNCSGFQCGDPTFLFDQSQQKLSAAIFNGLFVVDGVKFPTVQAAITAACAVGGGTVWIPPGTYPRNSAFTLCSNLNLIGAGRGQADSVTCPTTITTTQISGHLFDLTNFNDNHYSDFCVKNLATAGADTLILLSASQRNTFDRLYLSGLFAHQIQLKSSSTAAASTIWNTFRDIHTTGTAPGGDGCLLDATNATAKVINNNYFFNVDCTGGTGGFGFRTAGTSGTPVINENVIFSGELVATNGSAVTLAANTVRNFLCQNCNAEGSATGVTIGAGNTGKFDSSNISANGNNSAGVNVADSSVGGFTWPHNNIGGVTTSSFTDRDGNVSARSFCIAPAACDPGNINLISGTAIEAAGNTVFTLLTTGLAMNRPVLLTDGSAAAPSLTFGNEVGTGFGRLTPNQLSISLTGVNKGVFDTLGWRLSSTIPIGWSSNTTPFGNPADTATSRVAADVIGAGNGTQGDTSGEFRSAKISATYNAAGTVSTAVHVVQDSCVLGISCAVTLSGLAAFTNSSSYHCTATDATAINAVRVNQTAGNAVTFTGTGTDTISYLCVGN